MDSILRRRCADLPILEQARLGCLAPRDTLLDHEIAELWAPDDPVRQEHLRFAIQEACDAGDLREQKVQEIVQVFPRSYSINRQDFRRWLEQNGEWPLPVALRLTMWWSKAQSYQSSKRREDAATRAIKEARKNLSEELGRAPATDEVYDYLWRRDRTGVIDQGDSNSSRLFWRTDSGKSNKLTLINLAKRLDRL